MALSPEVIGRIILARFLSFSPKRYEAEISKIKTSGLYKALCSESIIIFRKFHKAYVCESWKEHDLNVLGRIEQKGKMFFLKYRSSEFAGEFQIDKDKLLNLIKSSYFPKFRRDEIEAIGKKLRLVSTRNIITHMIIHGIIEHQTNFFESCNMLRLAPLSQVEISNWIKSRGYPWVDNTMVSRIINNRSVVVLPNEKKMMIKDFFPSSRDIFKLHIKEILEEEEMKLKSNLLKRPYTDEEIRIKLREMYGLDILRRTVSYCRNQMGIAPFYIRAYTTHYPPDWVRFSPYFPMTLESVKENVPEMSGVYELSVVSDTIKYPYLASGVFYIGSSKNIRKRLKTYFGRWSNNEALNTFIREKKCFLQVFFVQR